MDSAGKNVNPAERHDIPSMPNGNPGGTANGEASKSLVPPYWSHRRYESYASVENIKPPPITLEDHTEEQFSDSSLPWARGVSIDEHVLVTGRAGPVYNVGKFIVWNCRIDTLDVSHSSSTLDCVFFVV